MRIVLVDPLGDILFSGESMVASTARRFGTVAGGRPSTAPASPVDDEDEECPQTKRSAESGVFPALRRPPMSRPIIIEPTPLSEPAPETEPEKKARVDAA